MSRTDSIMVCGDWHGNTRWAEKMVEKAAHNHVSKIVQCGDFGIWTHKPDGIRYLDVINDACRDLGVKVYFVPGNHENWTHIDWWLQNHPTDKYGMTFVRSHILTTGRLLQWTWNDRSFAAVGGAVSIDRQWRVPEVSWWSGEQARQTDVSKIQKTWGKSDYLFTHDAPTTCPMPQLKTDPDSQAHRQKMNDVAQVIQPKLWFHGHYHKWMPHYPFPAFDPYTNVWGLDMDGTTYSWGILNTTTDVFTPGPGVAHSFVA